MTTTATTPAEVITAFSAAMQAGRVEDAPPSAANWQVAGADAYGPCGARPYQARYGS